jgi:hypothetical protein
MRGNEAGTSSVRRIASRLDVRDIPAHEILNEIVELFARQRPNVVPPSPMLYYYEVGL